MLPAGGKVVAHLDFTDVYMDIYLPTMAAGRVKVGSDARIALDAYPSFIVPAYVSFVAWQAPLESMPPLLSTIMMTSASTHFVLFAQSILFRGAGFAVVWPQFLFVAGVGGLFLALALLRFRAVAVQAG